MAIKYITHDASGSADGSSVANAWTLAQAFAGLTAGDIGYVCATGTYALTGTAKAFTNAGTESAKIAMVGRSADGTADAVATISGASMTAANDIIAITATNYLEFSNLRLTAGRQHNLSISSGSMLYLTNCLLDNAVKSGLYCSSSTVFLVATLCRFFANGEYGYAASSGSRGKLQAIECLFDHNTYAGAYDSSGVGSSQKASYRKCLFFSNTQDGLKIISNACAGYFVEDCTIALNGGDGIDLPTNARQITIKNTILRSNGGYGINTNTGTLIQFNLVENICSHNNTSGHIDINSGTLPGVGNVLEDPAFVSETDGSENLTPTNVNLKKSYAYPAGGTSYFWIGAIQPQAAAGGRPEMRAAR